MNNVYQPLLVSRLDDYKFHALLNKYINYNWASLKHGE